MRKRQHLRRHAAGGFFKIPTVNLRAVQPALLSN